MTMMLIRMTFITVADVNDGAVAVDNDDQLVICFICNNDYDGHVTSSRLCRICTNLLI